MSGVPAPGCPHCGASVDVLVVTTSAFRNAEFWDDAVLCLPAELLQDPEIIEVSAQCPCGFEIRDNWEVA